MAKVTYVPVQNSDDNSVNVPVNQLWNYQSGAPGVTNDSSEGFAVGDLWVNSASDTMYVCSDVTVGAAVWTAGGAPLGTIVAADYTPAQTVLVAVADQTPLPQVVAAGEFVGRAIAGNLGVITAAQARAIIQATSEALFDNLASAGVIDGDRLKAGGLTSTNFNAATADGAILPRKNAVKGVTVKGAGAATATAAELVGGVFTHAAAGAPDLFTTDTAANIIANASVGATTGVSFEFTVVNGGAGTSQMTGGVGVTVVGLADVLTLTSGTFLAVVTGAATVSVIRK